MKIPIQNNLTIILFILVLSSTNIFAQISIYHGIVMPYDSNSRLPQTIGGITVAIPDFMSDAQMNPAGLISYKYPHLFINTIQNRTNYEMDFDFNDKSTSFSEYNFYTGIFSGSIPTNLFNKKTVFAVSINKMNSPEIEIWEALNEDNNLQIHHTRNGSVFNTTIGISSNFSDSFSFGLSMTKWFGNWTWHDEIESGDINGEGRFKYNGSSFTLGVLHKFKRISLGVVLHSPFTLMTSDQIQIKSWVGKDIHNIEQHFKGAARLGIAYHIIPKMTFGAGYRYQGSILLKDQIERESEFYKSIEDKYGKSHQISLGGEYTLSIYKMQLPVFLAYQTSWTTKTRRNYIPSYQYLSSQDGKNLSHSIMMGSNLNFKSYGIYFTTQWNYRTIHVFNEIVPPYS